jgi:hypothetical protein
MKFKFAMLDMDMTTKDKKVHMGASAIAAIAMFIMYHFAGFGAPNLGTTLLVVLIPGLLRELYNGFKAGSTGFSIGDMSANFLGINIGYLVALVVYKLTGAT